MGALRQALPQRAVCRRAPFRDRRMASKNLSKSFPGVETEYLFDFTSQKASRA